MSSITSFDMETKEVPDTVTRDGGSSLEPKEVPTTVTECDDVDSLEPKEVPTAIVASYDVSSFAGSSIAAENQETRPESPTTVAAGEDAGSQHSNLDDAESQENTPRKGAKWWHVFLMITAATNSLGLLCLPKALAPWGMVPSAIFIVLFGLIDWYTGFVAYLFAIEHPDARSYASLIAILFGKWRKTGRCVGEFLQFFVLLFIMAAHVVGSTTMIEALIDDRIPYVAAAIMVTVLMALCTLPRSLQDSWWLAALSCGSILVAFTVAAVSIGIHGNGVSNDVLWPSDDSAAIALGGKAASSLAFVFMSHTAYPSLIADMENPRHFPRALRLMSLVTIALSIIVTVYCQGMFGLDIASPLMNSADKIFRKLSWGLSVFTIAIAPVLSCIVSANSLSDGIWTWLGTPEVARGSSLLAKGVYWVLLFLHWLLALTIGLAVKELEHIVPIIGAAFAPLFCFIFPAMFWARLQGSWPAAIARLKKDLMAWINLLILVMGVFLLLFGLWGSIESLVEGRDAYLEAPVVRNGSSITP